MHRPILALTQGDPAGIGPEILLKLLTSEAPSSWQPLIVAELAALESVATVVPGFPRDRLRVHASMPARETLEADRDALHVLDPIARRRSLELGVSSAADAAGALAALDRGVEAVVSGVADALVTAPVAKSSIARHHLPSFRGHTEYLAERSGLSRYGRDYLMAFLAPDLQVALLSTHLPLVRALAEIRPPAVLEALLCLNRHAGGRIAVAGVNPHAGEGGLLGEEDDRDVAPAVLDARRQGVDAHGPISADSLFARARAGEFDWVLALYHDQGLIAVKTAAFGQATNWTLGLPYLRTSVDHGTAFDIAGRGIADQKPLAAVVATTLKLLSGELPRGRGPGG
ncbi:MAG: 4-hydroxythreonine-4-phosphate dehydrogenase PdxA [Acidobacteria bacterium]|nr:4-hydroxythreonine-4-phosphate dehydrogenase PdxA [Acidobacteriota bacterium]